MATWGTDGTRSVICNAEAHAEAAEFNTEMGEARVRSTGALLNLEPDTAAHTRRTHWLADVLASHRARFA